MVNEKKIFTLSDVTRSIRKTLQDRYSSTFWVKAEMNKLNYYSHSGHCYPELLEKKDGKVIAQMNATFWKADFNRVNRVFLHTLKEPLKDGINILFQASVHYDPVYGLSLRIHDVDPSFSLGELEREKLQTIDRLKREGVFFTNKGVVFPKLPQRLAIISVETSKGFADFTGIISCNEFGYKFFYMLFPALLQGEKSISSIINQLQQIQKVKEHFDVVFIIRGGGGDVGLTSYNAYELARAIALFPLPVITGIGHATNFTVSEMVAHYNAITPTAAANFLIQKLHEAVDPVLVAGERLTQISKALLSYFETDLVHAAEILKGVAGAFIKHENTVLRHASSSLEKAATGLKIRGEMELLSTFMRLKNSISMQFQQVAADLSEKELTLNHLDPEKLFARGYSITLADGKPVKNTRDVKKGSIITTILQDGTLISKVDEIRKNQG